MPAVHRTRPPNMHTTLSMPCACLPGCMASLRSSQWALATAHSYAPVFGSAVLQYWRSSVFCRAMRSVRHCPSLRGPRPSMSLPLLPILQRWCLCLAVPFALWAQVDPLYAQPLDTLGARLNGLTLDSLLLREQVTTEPRAKFVVLTTIIRYYLYLDRQEECMRTAMRTLELAEQTKNDTLLGRAHISIGNAFGLVNDMNAALDHFNTSFRIYEQIGDSSEMGFVCKEIAVMYHRLGDTEGALRYMRRALAYGMRPTVLARGMSVMAKCYLARGDLDSAFYCAQQADIVKLPREDPYGYSNYQGNLAFVYAARQEPDLAEPYFKRAVAVADSFDLPQPLITAAAGYSKLLIEQGRTEEALAWARKGFQATKGVRQPDLIVKASSALADAFHANRMTDSAFAYMKLSNAYRDTVTNTQHRSQLQNRSFARELKDREDAKLTEESKAARSRNIQYGIIGLIVITLLVFLLAISRTSVVGAKTIKNLSLVALLLLFEFINLVLSPLLGELSGQSPLLIMLAMVVIAGLLIPLHHRMEKLITTMLVSKNNRVRLEAARRTIEELEARPIDTNSR